MYRRVKIKYKSVVLANIEGEKKLTVSILTSNRRLLNSGGKS